MTTVIKVENLGKKYLIGHEKQERYNTLRDSISHGFQSMTRRLRSSLHAKTDRNELEEFWALKDLNFEIQQGDKVGIIGRNGAGKSTLLKILSRITSPTTGKITIKGRVASLLEVGTGFHPELSGRENIYLNGAILGMRKAEIAQKFDEIVAFAEVEKFLDTPVKRYSSGMYVRLAFSVAAHLEPDILVIDEILAVGDGEFQKKCLGKMGKIANEGRTIFFVSHNMAAVQQLCQSIILLDSGHLIKKGQPNEIIKSYIQRNINSFNTPYRNDLKNTNKSQLLIAAIKNSEHKDISNILFNENFYIETKWYHPRNIPSLTYTIRVFNENEIFVFAANTLTQEQIKIGNNGTEKILCKIDNILAPGDYHVEISAWIRPHTKVYKIENCLNFTVSKVPYTDSKPFLIQGKPIVCPKIEWVVL